MVKYNIWIGIWKSIKNVAVVVIPPAVLWLVNNYTQLVPEEYWPVAGTMISLTAYMTKNYIQVKKE